MATIISKRQVVLIAGQDGFLAESRDVLRAGLSSARWVTVDDTGARHKASLLALLRHPGPDIELPSADRQRAGIGKPRPVMMSSNAPLVPLAAYTLILGRDAAFPLGDVGGKSLRERSYPSANPTTTAIAISNIEGIWPLVQNGPLTKSKRALIRWNERFTHALCE
jgi:hypothetical protein